MCANVNIAMLFCSKIQEELETKALCLNGQQVTSENSGRSNTTAPMASVSLFSYSTTLPTLQTEVLRNLNWLDGIYVVIWCSAKRKSIGFDLAKCVLALGHHA